MLHPLVPASTQAIIFDIDGTLADTMPLHYKASQIVCNKRGFDFPLEYFYAKAGIPTHKVFEMLMKELGLPFDGHALATEKEAEFLKLIPEVKPLNPAAEVALACYGQLPMALGTGGTKDIATPIMEKIGMLSMFEIMVTPEMIQNPKPFPDTFLKAAEFMGIAPEYCLVFEDADPGLQAAKAAGMMSVDVRVF